MSSSWCLSRAAFTVVGSLIGLPDPSRVFLGASGGEAKDVEPDHPTRRPKDTARYTAQLDQVTVGRSSTRSLGKTETPAIPRPWGELRRTRETRPRQSRSGTRRWTHEVS